MLMLELDTTRKRQIDENNAAKLDTDDNKRSKYKVKAIFDSAVYARELKSGHLLELYYLVSWKNYLDEENT